MATEAQIRANRENAKKSTGPKTAEGKARVSQNARKHGFRSRTGQLLPGEEARYKQILEEMTEMCQPTGKVETALVASIAGARLALERCDRVLALARRDPAENGPQMGCTWPVFVRASRALDRALQLLAQLRTAGVLLNEKMIPTNPILPGEFIATEANPDCKQVTYELRPPNEPSHGKAKKR